MKWNRSTLALSAILSTSVLLTGCFGGGPGGGGGSSQKVSFQFTDESVSNFVYARDGQTVAQTKFMNNFSNFFISTAYAAVDKSISCTVSEKVSFEMDVFSDPIIIETSCSSNLESELRAGMLKSMAGKTVIIEYAGGSSQLGEDRKITFRNAASFFGVYNNINANGANELCRDYYDFKSSGKVETGLDVDATKALADAKNAGAYPITVKEGDGVTDIIFNSPQEAVDHCVADDGGLEEYAIEMAFRFKDGYLEMDPEGSDFNDDYDASNEKAKQLLDYNRWCVDDGSGTACEPSNIPSAYPHATLPTVCHEEDSPCGAGADIDPWI